MPIYGDDWLSLLLTCTPTLGIICYSALTVITNLEHRFKHQSNHYFQSTLNNLSCISNFMSWAFWRLQWCVNWLLVHWKETQIKPLSIFIPCVMKSWNCQIIEVWEVCPFRPLPFSICNRKQWLQSVFDFHIVFKKFSIDSFNIPCFCSRQMTL